MNSFSCCTRRIDKLARCQVQIGRQQEVIENCDFEEVSIIFHKKSFFTSSLKATQNRKLCKKIYENIPQLLFFPD